ncbi:MAG TPA: glycosyltransferase 87 family protein [Microlunatus sp.]|nr:glycosyltransferase 87 family protein [Microlunatus sp.]
MSLVRDGDPDVAGSSTGLTAFDRSGLRPAAPVVPDRPTWSDGFVRTVSARIGGPVGRYAAGSRWWNPARVVLLAATVSYLLAIIWRLPCRITEPGQNPDQFKLMCYSDIGLLYAGRGLLQGHVPYLQSGNYDVLEYPVLTGWFLELERRLAAWLGAAQGSDLTDVQRVQSTLVFVDVNTVLLGACFLLTVWALLRTIPDRPWDAMMLAVSPCVIAAALINWDLFAVALTALGCMFWARRRPAWSGVLLGLAAAAKLYPFFLLGPLLLLCLRTRRMPAFAVTAGAAVISWSVVNLPVLLLAPDAWLYFWRFNAQRGPDLGSFWYVLSLAGYEIDRVNLLSNGFFLLGCLGVAALILLAPRRPRFGQVAFLVVLAFVMTGKVYSPQYVLWLVPLLVLARPRWRDWLVFSTGELIYFGAIWWYLGGLLAPGGGDDARLYWLAVLIRLGTQSYVATLVVRDILRPARDPVRRDGADDPAGGVLDGAPDTGWWLGSPARRDGGRRVTA